MRYGQKPFRGSRHRRPARRAFPVAAAPERRTCRAMPLWRRMVRRRREAYFQTPTVLLCAIRPAQGMAGV